MFHRPFLLLAFLPALSAADLVQFTVSNPGNAPRVAEPVTSGFPLAHSRNLLQTKDLRLVDAGGTSIPAQFTVTARWGGAPADTTKPIKWLLVDFQIPQLGAHSTASYTIRDSGPSAAMPTLSVSESTESITVDTGAAQYSLSKLNGQLSGSGLAQPIQLQGTGTDGTSYSSSLSTPSLSIRLQGPMRVSIQVKNSLKSAGGAKLLDATSRYWFYAGQPTIRAFVTLENNTASPINAEQQIYCADIGSAGSISFRDVSLLVRPQLNGPVQFIFGGDGAHSGSLSENVMMYQDSSGTSNWNKFITLNDWQGHLLNCRPRMQAHVAFKGYQVTAGASVLGTGNQAQGWLKASDAAQGHMAVGIRDFWQNFPKAIRMNVADRNIELGLFPDEYGSAFNYTYNLRCGEHKTHEILICPASSASTMVQNASSPLVGRASAEHYLQSGAILRLPQRHATDWPDYETNVDYQLSTSPEYNTSMNWYANIFETLEKTDFYGFLDYGDVPIDYEGYGVAPLCLKYNMDYGMWMQGLRGGDPRYFSLAEAASRHIADVDILHTLHSPRHWSDGVSFQHSYHDEEGFVNPHRNYGGFAMDLISGTPGLLTTYYLTGYEKAWDSALEIADCVEYRLANDLHIQSTGMYPTSNGEGFALGEWIPGLYAGNDRPSGSMLAILVPAFAATADPRYLKAMDALVSWADPAKQPYINGPNGASGENDFINGNMLSYFLKGLGWYSDLLEEFGRSDTYNAKTRLVSFQNFLMKYVWVSQPDLGYGERGGYPYRWYFNNSPENQQDIDTSNWMQLSADTHALAYLYSGNTAFWQRAQVCFREGSREPFYPGDANTYVDTKGMANSINYGNVFLSMWKATPGAPQFTTHPQSLSRSEGQSASFSATATGQPTPSLQWRRNGANIAGATGESYTLASVSLGDNGASFTCVASNSAGSATSQAAILTVTSSTLAPAITRHPQSRSVTVGQTASFDVIATGTVPLDYQWLRNGTAIGNATLSSYTTPATILVDHGSRYSVAVSNSAGSVTSQEAILTVTESNLAPQFTTHPQSLSRSEGQSASFSATATGQPTPSLQWQRNGANIGGATGESYTLASVSLGDNGASFTCVASNSAGSATSQAAILTVTSTAIAPTITQHPENRGSMAGQTASFQVSATGTAPLTFQWLKNGIPIAQALSAQYSTPSLQPSDHGARFSVTVANMAGSISSNDALLRINKTNFDGSSITDGHSMGLIAAAWSGKDVAFDLNGDGRVDDSDLSLFLVYYGLP